MFSKRFVVLLVVAALGLLAVGCGADDGSTPQGRSSSTQPTVRSASIGTNLWFSDNCLYAWDGSTWVASGWCRTVLSGTPNSGIVNLYFRSAASANPVERANTTTLPIVITYYYATNLYRLGT